MISINKLASKIAKEIIEREEELGVKSMVMDCGVNVIDMGLNYKGSYEAGLLFTRASLGGLGVVEFGDFPIDEHYGQASVEVFVDEPLIACLASQIAGWKLGVDEFAVIGTGPARAQAAVESDWYLDMTPYRDRNDEVVLCIQDVKLPSEEICMKVAEACMVKPENVFILLAPSNCIVGSIQVSARVCEQVCHKMHEKGFDVKKVVQCRGRAPIAPYVKSELKSMGRINDALIYGSEVEFLVDSTDEEIEEVIDQLTSKHSSPYYGRLFEDVFVEADCDFFNVHHDFHSIAKIQITNINTGKTYSSGEIAYELLKKSFYS